MTRARIEGPATRDAYGQALLELGATNQAVVALDADLSKSTKSGAFGKQYPDRFFNVGIAEANMVGVAAGLASSGKIPFASSFASFLMCKGYDQLRMAIANPQLNAKFVGSHGGISLGEDGSSQQSVEDIALARALPGFTVLVPADAVAAKAITYLAAEHVGPVYIRTGRPKAAKIYDEGARFEIGKANVLRPGKDITIVAYGLLVFEALIAADMLAEKGIDARVIDLFCLKPLDEETLALAAKETKGFVTAEEHLLNGGLGEAVAGAIARSTPRPIEMVGLNDTYSESGTPAELMEAYGLTATHVVAAAEKLWARLA